MFLERRPNSLLLSPEEDNRGQDSLLYLAEKGRGQDSPVFSERKAQFSPPLSRREKQSARLSPLCLEEEGRKQGPPAFSKRRPNSLLSSLEAHNRGQDSLLFLEEEGSFLKEGPILFSSLYKEKAHGKTLSCRFRKKGQFSVPLSRRG